MPWVNTQTGQSSGASPDWAGGSYSNTQWVNDPVKPQPTGIDLSGSQGNGNRGTDNTYAPTGSRPYGNPGNNVYTPRVATQFEKDMWRLFSFIVKAVLALAVLAVLGYYAITAFESHWNAKNAAGPMAYSETEVELRSLVPSWRGQSTFLVGRNVIVDGGIHNKNLFAYRDIAVQGDITNSHVSSTMGTLTVHNVANSVLTAHHIVVTGTAVNTKQVILGSKQGR